MFVSLKKDMRAAADPGKIPVFMRFFKTGKGEYGEGDRFLGLAVPMQRKIARKYRTMSLSSVETLLHSRFHEERLTALFIFMEKFRRGDEDEKERIYEIYLRNTQYINNWDLVDVTAPHIMGAYVFDKKRTVLYRLAKSKDLWEKRIAILATQYFIRQREYDDTLKIADMLLADKHDLIHKAVGWMLREVGNRSLPTEEGFLRIHAHRMSRTTLRYAIEKFSPAKRKKYLAMKVKKR